ncbi:MAG: hypothetical protein VX777_01765 [Chlamydiota bacterium]|nr:hypothetical protein [Chlamydiota bacterium]
MKLSWGDLDFIPFLKKMANKVEFILMEFKELSSSLLTIILEALRVQRNGCTLKKYQFT